MSILTTASTNSVTRGYEYYKNGNVHSVKEISHITGVKKDTIYNILYKKQWMIISKKYNIDGFNKMRKRKI